MTDPALYKTLRDQITLFPSKGWWYLNLRHWTAWLGEDQEGGVGNDRLKPVKSSQLRDRCGNLSYIRKLVCQNSCQSHWATVRLPTTIRARPCMSASALLPVVRYQHP